MQSNGYTSILRGFVVLALSMSLIVGCKRDASPSANSSPGTNSVESSESANEQKPFDWAEYQRRKLESAAKVEEILSNPPPSLRIPLPNWVSGPGRPKPVGINFYTLDDNYTNYLLCSYDVQEQHYDPSNEPGWFETSILQMRGQGVQKFPPVKWIAITIKNAAEHKGASTFEKSHKVGALFQANEVFDPQINPADIIAKAKMDRHPFHYDPKTEEYHWLIVEKDAAAKGQSK